MIKKDYYELLGITRTADGVAIKRAYRKLAIQFHPDKNPGDKAAEDRFKETAEAYEVLSHPDKRQIYDQFGHQGLEGTGFHGFSGVEDIFSSFGDIFEDFFGFGSRRGARSGPMQGGDLRYDLQIDFMEACFGVDKKINVSKTVSCHECSGMGVEHGHQPEVCPKCQGAGQIGHRQGFFTISTTCPYCQGTGAHISHPCKKCKGSGQNHEIKKLTVKIPAGVDTGIRLMIHGEGEAGQKGGPPGNLYVFLQVKDHDFFKRDGQNIVCQIPISMVHAALGLKITIPTLAGEEEVEIPKGIQSGQVFTLKGKGVSGVRSKRKGDQLVIFIVKTPQHINKEQEELLKKLATFDVSEKPAARSEPKQQKKKKKRGFFG